MIRYDSGLSEVLFAEIRTITVMFIKLPLETHDIGCMESLQVIGEYLT